MRIGDHVLSSYTKYCDLLSTRIRFADQLTICCNTDNFYNYASPMIPYMDTAEETINNFFKKRNQIIDELNYKCPVTDLSKPCFSCSRLKYIDSACDNIQKITSVVIACYPSICQAKCIYCFVTKNPTYTKILAEQSKLPKLISEMIQYLEKNSYLAKNCIFIVLPAEITVTPHKNLLLDAVSNYCSVFFTNAFHFELKIADSMKKNGSMLKVSMDSGTKETFRVVKGKDQFEATIKNLKRYREYDTFDKMKLKYIVIPGVNDSDHDYDGIINILHTLNMSNLQLSFDSYMPFRSVFYSFIKLISMLKDSGLTFSLADNVHNTEQINECYNHFICSNEKTKRAYKQKRDLLQKAFWNEFQNNYDEFRVYVYEKCLAELINYFSDNSRFLVMGQSKNKRVSAALKKINIPTEAVTEKTLVEVYNSVKKKVDILLIPDRKLYLNLKAHVVSEKGSSLYLISIDEYFLSLDPTEVFLHRILQ